MAGMGLSRRVVVIALAVLGWWLWAPRSVPGQEAGLEPSRIRAGEAPDWGTASWSIHQIANGGFTPVYKNMDWVLGIDYYLSGDYFEGWPRFVASLSLPSGALVVRIETDACDTSATEEVEVELLACGSPGASCWGGWATIHTGPSQTEGCQWFLEDLDPTLTVDNYEQSYFVVVYAPTLSACFRSVNVYYQLQISPAPASATFGDVPVGYWAFQHVEALAASGITAGCGGGNFCPDAPLTRGQMAVFLAKALGLHWPDL